MELATEVDRLREKLEAVEKEKAELETFQNNTVIHLSQKERERMGKLSNRNSLSTEKCCEYTFLY
jgi:hypothetical protein